MGLSVALLALARPTAAAPPDDREGTRGGEATAALRAGCLARSRVSALATTLDGRVLLALDADRPMVPASTQKLFTAAAALKRLGPARELHTRFLATGPLDEAGILRGDLVVRGEGAPDLTASELWTAAQELRVRGLRRVEGALVGDDSGHEPPGRPAGWASATNHNPYNAPSGALVVNWNVVRVDVHPGREPDAPVRVALFPLEEVARVDSTARTRAGRRAIALNRVVEDGRNVIRVRGSLPPGAHPVREYLALEDPTGTFLAALEELLAREGIEVLGGRRRGTVPPDAVELYAHPSRPLGELVRLMNKHSNNLMAEMLLRDIAVAARGEPGTTAAGLDAVRGLLSEWSVPQAGTVLADGSGLSRENRTTARALVALLRAAAADPGVGPELLASLPIAGEDGTLEDRPAPGVRGAVRAKTGSLSGVYGLAGYLRTDRGEPGAFAFLVEAQRGCSRGRVLAALDRALEALGTAPATPPLPGNAVPPEPSSPVL